MKPTELAARHPRLFHQTAVGTWPSIRTHGLLPPRISLQRAGLSAARIEQLTQTPRPNSVVITDGPVGRVEISDNSPLLPGALAGCLNDGITPSEWCAALAERVFFWADERRLMGLLGARAIRGRAREVLVIDTLSFATAEAQRIELTPFNSGSAIRKPPRRDFGTFAKMSEVESYAEWSGRRRAAGVKRTLDRVHEVVIAGVVDVAPHVVERRRYEAGDYIVTS